MFLRSLLFLPFAALACFSTASAQTQQKKTPLLVHVNSAYAATAPGTCAPQSVEITNNTGGDHMAVVEFLDGWSGRRQQAFPLLTPDGKTVTTVVYPDSDTAECYRLRHSLKTEYNGSLYHNYREMSFYAVLQKELGKNWSLLKDDAYRGGVSDCDLMAWPADVRMYLSQTHLIIPETTYTTSFDEAHRRAIRQWVLCGGNLLLIGETDTPPSEERLGDGKILHLPDLTFDGLDEKEKNLRMANFVKNYLADYGSICSDSPKSYTLTTPSAILGLVLLLFAAITGPVCLFWWAPAGKRHRLFVLIPAVSAAFSILLLLLILLGEGTGGLGSRTVHVYVNPADHTAMIVQNQQCRTSVLLENTFELPENAAFMGKRQNKDTSYYSLEHSWRNGRQCGGGWFTSRSQLQHRIILPVASRAALTLVETTKEGAPVFQSTFPAALSRVTYTDDAGRTWHIDSLPPAVKKAASPAPKGADASPAASLPPPGHFSAEMLETQGDLGPIPTLPSIHWEQTTITVSGPVTASNPNHA